MKDYLEAKELRKSYGKKRVLDGVSLNVSKGEIVGLLGPNGAGKTTSFSIPQDSGQVFLDGEDITNLPMYLRARKGLCLLPQEPSAFRKLSVEDNLFSVIETSRNEDSDGNGDVQRIMGEFGLHELAKAKAYTLSGGERRRLEIARALLTMPTFMLLDEPFTGIDPLTIQDLQDIILSLKDRGIGILVTDHSVREALKITDRAYIIDGGKILKEGAPQELVSSEEVRKSYLGDDFSLS
jgi:lipopolysaccharide export system ATP-binding protein